MKPSLELDTLGLAMGVGVVRVDWKFTGFSHPPPLPSLKVSWLCALAF